MPTEFDSYLFYDTQGRQLTSGNVMDGEILIELGQHDGPLVLELKSDNAYQVFNVVLENE